jgi:hypothetical protein
VSPVGSSAVLGASAVPWVGRSSAFAATRFGFRPRFFGVAGVAAGSPSSTNCDSASSVFEVGTFLRLARVFVFSDGADASMATGLVFLAGGIGK